MNRTWPRRRYLVATLLTGGMAWLANRFMLCTAGIEGASPRPEGDAIALLCSELHCPATIGMACWEALPPLETSVASLKQAILRDSWCGAHKEAGRIALRDAVRRRSQQDFLEGRVVNVNGWTLSLTETRVYALAALLPTAARRPG